MTNNRLMIFIHGLEGTSQGIKAVLLRSLFPDIIIPDFRGTLTERMELLVKILGDKKGWTIIGSSLGGLMAALFAQQYPQQVKKLILLAPALTLPEFSTPLLKKIEIPTIIYHGSQDDLIPIQELRNIAERSFSDLTFIEVDDDHGLYQTVHVLDWNSMLGD